MDLDLGDTRLIISKCKKHRLSKNQAAYVLATAYWETNRTVKPIKEAYWLSESWRATNLRYYPWYGRGYVQLTWEANYVKAGTKLNKDFTTNPDAVMDPENSSEILVLGSKEGWFTSRKLNDYINDTKTDYRGARRIINGTDKASTIEGIAKEYEKALGFYTLEEPVAPVSVVNPFAKLLELILSLFKGTKK